MPRTGRALETQVGVLKGKLGYMAPEQLERLELDGRVDQFSLGILLWESLAGRRLFTAPNPIAAIELIRHCEIPDLRDIRQDCPESLIQIVEKALSRNREDRFESCEALGDALESVLHQEMGIRDVKAGLRAWVEDLFPESGDPDLSEHEVKTLFSAEDRGEEVTDPRVVDDATEVFIPDTTRIDIYRRQIEELLERRRDTEGNGKMMEKNEKASMPPGKKTLQGKNRRQPRGDNSPKGGWALDATVFFGLMALVFYVWTQIQILR